MVSDQKGKPVPGAIVMGEGLFPTMMGVQQQMMPMFYGEGIGFALTDAYGMAWGRFTGRPTTITVRDPRTGAMGTAMIKVGIGAAAWLLIIMLTVVFVLAGLVLIRKRIMLAGGP